MTSRRLAGLARGVLSSFAWTLWQTQTRVVVMVEKELKKVEAKGGRGGSGGISSGGSFPGDGTFRYIPTYHRNGAVGHVCWMVVGVGGMLSTEERLHNKIMMMIMRNSLHTKGGWGQKRIRWCGWMETKKEVVNVVVVRVVVLLLLVHAMLL